MSDVSDLVPIVNSELVQAAAIERQCVSVGWFDPVGLHDAAYKFGMCGERFTDPGCGSIFSYIVTVADLDRQPDPDECATAIKEIGGVLWPIEILDRVIQNADGSSSIEDLVATIAKRHREREAARRHLQRASDLLAGRGAYQILITKRRPTTTTGLRIPARLKTKTRRTRCA